MEEEEEVVVVTGLTRDLTCSNLRIGNSKF